jgi:hypothetical protein
MGDNAEVNEDSPKTKVDVNTAEQATRYHQAEHHERRSLQKAG